MESRDIVILFTSNCIWAFIHYLHVQRHKNLQEQINIIRSFLNL